MLHLRAHGELPISELHPTGQSTVNKMVEKVCFGRTHRDGCLITQAAEAAFKAELPDTDKSKPARKPLLAKLRNQGTYPT